MYTGAQVTGRQRKCEFIVIVGVSVFVLVNGVFGYNMYTGAQVSERQRIASYSESVCVMGNLVITCTLVPKSQKDKDS